MTTAGAGMDVRGKTPDIHPTGGTAPPPATPTACAGPPASRGRRRGAGRHGGHGADERGPPAVAARPGLPGRHRQPAPVPGPPPARRCTGEDRQGRCGGARGPRRRVPGHGGNGAGGRDRRQAPRHAGASGGPRRPAHRAEAVPAGVGEPDPEGPVTGVLEEPAAAVSGYDRRTGELVRDPESLAESYRIPVTGVLEEPAAAVSGYDRRTGELVRDPESLAESYRIPVPVPGIGPVTAASPVAWMGGPGATASRQAAAPGGVAPIARDSGTLRGGRHMGGGRRRPGDVPRMAAMAARTSGPGMKALYGRLRERARHPGSPWWPSWAGPS